MSVVPYWFLFSVIAIMLDSLRLWHELSRNGVRVSHMFGLTPGYLEAKYVEWCEKAGVSPRRRMTVRVVLAVNLLLSLFALILLLTEI